MDRQIIHINPDDFFASALRVKDSGLRGAPVVVGYLNSRGYVVSASYEAREKGIHPGLTMAQAKRICPRARLIQVDWGFYHRVSSHIFEILARYTPLVERVGLEEAFLDYTGCKRLFGMALDACCRIREEIKNRVSLDVSIGVASNKVVSKVASSAAKRASLVDIFPGSERSFLASFPISSLPGLGPRFIAKLHTLSVERIADIQSISPSILERVFGSKGLVLHRIACGKDPSPVRSSGSEKKIQVEEEFSSDIIHATRLGSFLYALVERLCQKLRQESLVATRVIFSFLYSDHVLVRRTIYLPHPTDMDDLVYRAVEPVFKKSYTRRVRVKKMCLSACGFSFNSRQMFLFDEFSNRKRENLYHTMDIIRKRFPSPRHLMLGRTYQLWGTASKRDDKPVTRFDKNKK